jgi:hypothetical protein
MKVSPKPDPILVIVSPITWPICFVLALLACLVLEFKIGSIDI